MVFDSWYAYTVVALMDFHPCGGRCIVFVCLWSADQILQSICFVLKQHYDTAHCYLQSVVILLRWQGALATTRQKRILMVNTNELVHRHCYDKIVCGHQALV